jgi:hypothetical protein
MNLHNTHADYINYCISLYEDRAEMYVQCKAQNNAATCRATADALRRALSADDIRTGLSTELQAANNADVRSVLSLAIQKTA